MEVARTWLPRGLALAAFCLYALAAPPSFYWLDSAELSAAAFALGSPHPTGFPLYCILAKAATFMPFGELAFRVNLFSASCAALAVLWSTRLVCESCRDDLPALVGAAAGGALLALSLGLMRQATVAEVYAPTVALLAGTLVLVDRVARGGDARWGLALALVVGLGVGLHVTYGLVAAPLVVLLAVRLYRGARWPLLAPLLVVLVAGALLAYLPLRSASGRIDEVDWGHPDRLATLVGHITAASIRTAHADEIGATSGGRLGHHAAVLAGDMADAVGPFTALAALFGLGWLLRQRRTRWLAGTLVTIALGDVAYSLGINPMGLIDLQNGLPLTLVMCIGAGVGVAWLARNLGAERGPIGALAGASVGAAVGMLLVIPVALVSVPEVWSASAPGGDADVPRAWSQAALDQTPPGGVALVQGDSTAAGLMYLTVVENARPDAAVLVRQLLPDLERTRAVLARTGMDPATIASNRPLASILASGRPITWEIGQDGLPGARDVAVGVPLSRLLPAGARASQTREQAASEMLAAAATLADLFAGAGSRDRNARRVLAHSLTALGRVAYGSGDGGTAELLFDGALSVRPGHLAALVNRGVVAAQRRDWPAAIEWTERALVVDPGRVSARINAARYHIQAGNDARAREHVERALELEPGLAGAWALAAVLDLRAGQGERAAEHLRRARDIDPADADVLHVIRQLEEARARHEGRD